MLDLSFRRFANAIEAPRCWALLDAEVTVSLEPLDDKDWVWTGTENF